MKRGLKAVKLGYVPISKFVFSAEDAQHYRDLVQDQLTKWGVHFVSLDGVTSDGMLYKKEDLPKVVAHLRAEQVDALFCPHCNFGTEDVAALLGREMGLPYLLWGPRDEHPLPDGSRLRDTQCGLFATSHVLGRLGVPFTYILNSRVSDPIFKRGVLNFIRVAAVVKTFRTLRIGQIGQRVDFFWSTMVNEAELMERFGIEVLPIYLSDVLSEIRAKRQARDEDLLSYAEEIRKWVEFKSLGEDQILAIVALHLTLREIAVRNDLSAIAMQCFPIIQKEFGIYPCLANSLLSNEGVPVICETDIHGAISACLLQSANLFETPPFFADLTIRHPTNDRAELLWHCGSFPLDLADSGVRPFVGSHFIMPGTDKGVCHWRIRGGEVTLCRFEQMGGSYSLAMGGGKGTSGPETVGTYLWFEVADWAKWERKFIEGPYIHHVAGILGQATPILYEACKYLPGVQPDPIEPDAQELGDIWWREEGV
ncbi:MAG: L-fucose/L-arabinose isomerase family protein [Candidatus Latescibacterota bacterium]